MKPSTRNSHRSFIPLTEVLAKRVSVESEKHKMGSWEHAGLGLGARMNNYHLVI